MTLSLQPAITPYSNRWAYHGTLQPFDRSPTLQLWLDHAGPNVHEIDLPCAISR